MVLRSGISSKLIEILNNLRERERWMNIAVRLSSPQGDGSSAIVGFEF